MRLLTAVLLFLALLVPGALAAPPAASHPILGTWKLIVPGGSCAEIYRFRGDGTTFVTSAQEVSESVFSIPPEPSAKGFYKLEDRVVKDNGKKDCTGAVMKIGTKVTNFIQFHPSELLFVMCADESFDACIGPFLRVQGQNT